MKVVTDSAKINEFLTRGVENVFPSVDFLRARMEEGKPLTMYFGIDPTAPTLHLGNVVPLLKLADWQKLGHNVIFLIGDFTAMIGDPTDKMSARTKLSEEDVQRNFSNYSDQAGRILNVSTIETRHNSEWWKKLSFQKILEIESAVTYSQVVKRDMFQKRAEEGKEIYMHELQYPILQGYDSVELDVDGEIGGNDQTFNMLMGRDLMKQFKGKEKFVIAMKLLVDPSGKKMGKTEGNMVALSDSRQDIFGKVMSWPDTAMPLAFELLTRLAAEEIQEILDRGPRDAKLELAERITTLALGDAEEGKEARENFLATFSRNETPTDIPVVRVTEGDLLQDTALGAGLVASKSDYRRLLEDGAVSIDNQTVADIKETVRSGVLRIGKHRFLKIVLKE